VNPLSVPARPGLGLDYGGAGVGDRVHVPLNYGDVSVCLRVVRLLDDGCLFVRQPRLLDPVRIFILAAMERLPRAKRAR